MNSKKIITFGKISANLDKPAPETPVEASSSGFGIFGRKREESNVKKMDEIKPEDEEETQSMQKLMGITGFGKKAKSFDVQEMMENITKTISGNKIAAVEKEKPAKVAESAENKLSDNDDDDEDDFIGPPIPSLLPVTLKTSKDLNVEKKDEKNESDDDDDNDDDDDDVSVGNGDDPSCTSIHHPLPSNTPSFFLSASTMSPRRSSALSRSSVPRAPSRVLPRSLASSILSLDPLTLHDLPAFLRQQHHPQTPREVS